MSELAAMGTTGQGGAARDGEGARGRDGAREGNRGI
jgi:hypothetical protein